MASDIGVIFDWDGVIIDSHDQHESSWFRLAEELGKPMTRALFKESFGMRNESIIPGLFGWADAEDTQRIRELGDRKEELYREVLRDTGIRPLPGVRALLESLRDAEIPCVVGSSTSRLNIDTVIAVAELEGLFGAISAAEDVTKGKPEPDVFLKAAELIQREPANCVVFEDAFAGIEAGKRAGMKVVGVATTHPVEKLDMADTAVESLEGFGLEQIQALLGQ